MKKILSIIVSFVLIFSLYGCGKNADISEEMLSAGKNLIKISDDYMDGKIDYDTATRKMGGTIDTINDIYDDVERTDSGLPVYINDYEITSLATYLSIALSNEHYGSGTYEELLNKRNEIAEIIGEKKRNI